MKKFLAFIFALSFLCCSTAFAESRNVFEFLLLYQQSIDTLKYEYEDIENYRVESTPYFLGSDLLSFGSGLLTLDSEMNIQDALLDFVNVNADDEKNEESTFRFIAALCALEYGAIDYPIHDLYYQSGLTENETVFDETMYVFNNSFDVGTNTILKAMQKNETLLYEGKNYSYYLCYQYVEADKSRDGEEYEAFYIRAVLN